MTSPTPQIWLAPLRGYTDVIFRNTYTSFYKGLDGAIAPFITTVKGPKIKSSHLKDVKPKNNQGLPVVPQILSKSAVPFIVLAKHLSDSGYDVINWNLGCPYPMVAKKFRGSGLLPYPEKVMAFLDEVLAEIPCRLSIKLRLGYRVKNEILTLLPLLNQYPLEELIIHPRTGQQMYDGVPDEDAFRECLATTSHTVVYNGDIKSSHDFNRLKCKFPNINKWLIGRGLLADPLLPSRIKMGSIPKEIAVSQFHRFHNALYDGYANKLDGPGHLLSRMKGFWRYFSNGFSNGQHMLKKIQKCKSLKTYQLNVRSLFDLEMKAI